MKNTAVILVHGAFAEIVDSLFLSIHNAEPTHVNWGDIWRRKESPLQQ